MVTTFTPIQTGNSELQRMQSNISKAVTGQSTQISTVSTKVNANPLADGVVRTVSFSASLTDVSVNHGLGVPATFVQAGCTMPGALAFISPNNVTNQTPNQTTVVRIWTPATGTGTSPVSISPAVSIPLIFYPS